MVPAREGTLPVSGFMNFDTRKPLLPLSLVFGVEMPALVRGSLCCLRRGEGIQAVWTNTHVESSPQQERKALFNGAGQSLSLNFLSRKEKCIETHTRKCINVGVIY